WMILADYLLLPALAYLLSATWLHGLIPGIPAFVWVFVFAILNTVTNIFGIRFQARSNFVLLGLELLVLAIFIGVAIDFVFIQGHGAGGWSIKPWFQPEHLDWSFVAAATSVAVLSFLGFDAISTLAEEVKNPRKTVGNATVLS